ncbi:hypothetical protein KFZ70_09900 [Tamlana fucoidanivorans]|uniref:DUF4129 domain-containing protein n=1 Tax=Allotamlana fucoidanivorans TaxID=2583814 RepID=A0A5C4SQ57_9FLAO|nr:hypothetical protein [Tamlana fucoidanivorans]TNJ45822.1 hypothetical protein FGF67_05425 [Tamlana fucoidanivorans]
MKLNPTYVLLFSLIAMFQVNQVYAITLIQEPIHARRFDDNFKSRYSSDKFNYEGKVVIKTTPSGSGHYEDYKQEKLKQKDDDNSKQLIFNLGPLAYLFYIAIALAVGYLVFILINEGGSGLFSSKAKRSIASYEDINAENINSTNIESLILEAEKNNNYRLAIRFYYLLILQNLSTNNHIQFEDDKTNNDYLNEVSGTPFGETFTYISYLYNYIWYGLFPVNMTKYEKAKQHFTLFLKQVNS